MSMCSYVHLFDNCIILCYNIYTPKEENMEIETRANEIKTIILDSIDDTNHADMLQIEELSFAWATLEYMNNKIKNINGLLSDKVFMSSRDKMNSEIQKYSSSLGLNRSQRMKVTAKIAESTEKDPLLSLLGE